MHINIVLFITAEDFVEPSLVSMLCADVFWPEEALQGDLTRCLALQLSNCWFALLYAQTERQQVLSYCLS